MAKKKKNDLIRIFIEGDKVYIEQKANMSQREMNVLAFAFSDMMKFLRMKPETKRGKLWLN